MAQNIVFEDGDQLSVPVGSGTEAGDPVLIGTALPGVALTDRDANGNATVKFNGVASLAVVVAVNALAVGDPVYITGAGAITRTASGNTRFGYALGALATNVGGTINVKIGY